MFRIKPRGQRSSPHLLSGLFLIIVVFISWIYLLDIFCDQTESYIKFHNEEYPLFDFKELMRTENFRFDDCGDSCYQREDFAVGQLPGRETDSTKEKGYSGHLKVREWMTEKGEKGKAEMFFWYFPPKEESTTGSQPLIIWLQGGPGSSSFIGLFSELGPYQILSNLTLERRPISWNQRYHLLFIDQPVGTGFSYVSPFNNSSPKVKDKTGQKYNHGIPANEKAVAIDLLVFLKQFYSVFPELKISDLYVTGESYAGKYVPWFSSAIIEYNNFWRSRSQLNELIPLAGMGIGDGLTDPITQIKYHADLALNFGLTTYEQSRHISRLASLAIHQVKSGQYIKASQTREELFRYFDIVSGGINVYDIRKGSNQNSWDLIEKFARLKTVKGALNVNSKADSGRDEWDYCVRCPWVRQSMQEEVMKSAAFLFPRILNLGYKVLLYQAQFDFKDGTVGSTEWISNLKWEGRKQYHSANRTIYYLNNNTVGYITSTSSSSSKYHLTRVELLNAGHLAPSDQPEVCFDMLSRFIDGQY